MTKFVDSRNGHIHMHDAATSVVGALMFGPLYWLFKGMFGWFFVSMLLNVLTFGVAWIIIVPFAPSIHRNYLLSQGFVEDKKVYNKPVVTNQRIEPCL